MFLYQLSLQPSTSVSAAIAGQFIAGSRHTDVVLVRGAGILQAIRIDGKSGKIRLLAPPLDALGSIRSLASVRVGGDQRDWLVIGSDSGKLVIVGMEEEEDGGSALAAFRPPVIEETFGRSGCRRSVPGQYVAADPHGRAVMIAAVDGMAKLVYLLTAGDALTKSPKISSPLEVAHKVDEAAGVVFDVVGVNVGWENPQFAVLESSNDGGESMSVVFYEVDLGLMVVRRKWSYILGAAAANRLIPLPTEGLLICEVGEALRITWIGHESSSAAKSISLPQRESSNAEMIVASAVFHNKGVLFVLVQSNLGDLFKVTVGAEGDLQVSYFDTIPPASALVILKTGFLVAFGAASTDHTIYQFIGLGDQEPPNPVSFVATTECRNLRATDGLPNLAAIADAKLLCNSSSSNDEDEDYQLVSLHSGAAIQILRHGFEAELIARTDLPAGPRKVWTIGGDSQSTTTTNIILSFADSTVVLRVQGDAVEEEDENAEQKTITQLINRSCTSLAIQPVGKDGIVQVTPDGFSLYSHGSVMVWQVGQGYTVTQCAVNGRQVVLYAEGGTPKLVYLELDASEGRFEEMASIELPTHLSCLALGPLPEGRQRSRFLAVGSVEDSAIRILCLDPEDRLGPLSLHGLTAMPMALSLHSNTSDGLRLMAGLANGLLVWMPVDGLSGSLGRSRSHCLEEGMAVGSVEWLNKTTTAVTFTGSGRTWLLVNDHCAPLGGDYRFGSVAPFVGSSSSSLGSLMIIGIDSSCMSILSLLGQHSDPGAIPLRRQLIPIGGVPRKIAVSRPKDQRSHFAIMTAEAVALFNPSTGALSEWTSVGGTAHCLAFCTFHSDPSTLYLAVGVSEGFEALPRRCRASHIKLFRIDQNDRLILQHQTDLEGGGIPSAMAAFGGMLLVGLGGWLRLMDRGQKRLLRKCQTALPSFPVWIDSQGWRVYVADALASFLLFHYRPDDNVFTLGCDDPIPRHLSTALLLDFDTVCGADREGNVFAVRVPPHLGPEMDGDFTAAAAAAGAPTTASTLFAAGTKVERVFEYHLGDTIVSMERTALRTRHAHNSRSLIHYTTVSGATGVLLPLTSRSDALFLQTLEAALCDRVSLIGRDHLNLRSSYTPCRSVIDGDLCEAGWARARPEQRASIAQILDRSEEEVTAKLQEIRSMIGW